MPPINAHTLPLGLTKYYVCYHAKIGLIQRKPNRYPSVKRHKKVPLHAEGYQSLCNPSTIEYEVSSQADPIYDSPRLLDQSPLKFSNHCPRFNTSGNPGQVMATKFLLPQYDNVPYNADESTDFATWMAESVILFPSRPFSMLIHF